MWEKAEKTAGCHHNVKDCDANKKPADHAAGFLGSNAPRMRAAC